MPENTTAVERQRAAAVRIPPRAGAPVMEAPPRPGEVLAGYGAILARRRWTALAVAALVAGCAAVVILGSDPVYRAVARVQVNAEAPRVQTLEGVYEQIPTNQEFLRTQIRVLETDLLAWRTVEQLGLGNREDFLGRSPEKMRWRSDQDRKNDLIRRFREAATVKAVPGSRLIEVGFEAREPELAAQAANALVANYLEFNFEQQYEATRAVSTRMGRQLDDLKAAVEKSQSDLAEYERKHAIYNVGEKQNEVGQRLAQLSADFTAAQAARMERESVYEQVNTSAEDAAALSDDALLQRLVERAAELKTQYADALAQYGPAYPKVVRAEKQLAEAQQSVEAQRARLVRRIKAEYEAARKRERLLGGALAAQKARAAELNQVLVGHNLLQGEFESYEQLYQRLLQQLKDASVAAGLRATNIHVVDAALAPSRPERANTALYLALALLGGCVAGVAGAFVEEGFDTSIRTAEELEEATALPVLGAIPAKNSICRRAWQPPGWGRQQPDDGVALAVAWAPASVLAESYRALRTALLLGTAGQPPKSLLVTSALPGEGKSTTALNLAASLAQRKGPVILVRADFRGVGTPVNGNGDLPGLTEVLRGRRAWRAAVRPVAEVPGLMVLGTGENTEGSLELLCSESMRRLLQELGAEFRCVVVDSSAVLAAGDTAELAAMVDGVILLVESGATPRRAVWQAQKRLYAAGAQLAGTVLNRFDAAADGFPPQRIAPFASSGKESPRASDSFLS